jgi:hypothetical protein
MVRWTLPARNDLRQKTRRTRMRTWLRKRIHLLPRGFIDHQELSRILTLQLFIRIQQLDSADI